MTQDVTALLKDSKKIDREMFDIRRKIRIFAAHIQRMRQTVQTEQTKL